MMLKYISILITCLLHFNVSAQSEYFNIFKDSISGNYGLKKADEILLKPIYSSISDECREVDLIFYVKNKEGKYAIYYHNTKTLTPFKFDQLGYHDFGIAFINKKGETISYKTLEKDYLTDGKPIQFLDYGISKSDDVYEHEVSYYCDFMIPKSLITHKKTNEEIYKKFITNIIVKIDEKWGIVDPSGSFIIDAIHEKRPFLNMSSSNIWFVREHNEVKLYDVYFNPIIEDKAQFLFPEENVLFDPYILLITNKDEQYITVIDKLGDFSCKFPYIPGKTYTEINNDSNFFIIGNEGLWSAVSTFESEKAVVAKADSYENLLIAMKKFNSEYESRTLD